MGIKNTYHKSLTSGVPGQLAYDGPWRSQAVVISSETEGNHYAYAYTRAIDGTYVVGGEGLFGGVLVRPLTSAIEPTLTKGAAGELAQMGPIFVPIKVVDATAAALGGKVYFNKTTGLLQTTGTGGTEIEGAVISHHQPSAANSDGVCLAVITLNGPLP
jgi:hypothetical protein